MCPKDLEEILRDVDLNGDGLVDFEGKLSSPPSQLSVKVSKMFVVLHDLHPPTLLLQSLSG